MNDDKQLKKDTIEGGCDDCGIKSTHTSRRKFTKGAFAAPVIASLMSTPAWGTNENTACSISGLRSGNTSTSRDYSCNGQGCTPGFWKNNVEAWPAALDAGVCIHTNTDGTCAAWYTGSATKFHEVFGFTPAGAPANVTLVSLLTPTVAGVYYSHLVAALLNSITSSGLYGATPQQIYDLAQEVEYGNASDPGFISKTDAKNTLDKMNNQGCFLDAHGNSDVIGDCGEDMIFNNSAGGCIPMCNGNQRYDADQGKCVPK